MVSETASGPDPDQEADLFELFRKAWIEAEGDEFEHNMARQSLRASAPKFAERMKAEEAEWQNFQARAAAAATVRDTLPPEGLCNHIQENPTADVPAWQHCVFLPNHEGKHSWQR